MKDDAVKFMKESTSSMKESFALIDKLFAVARPETVFSQPVNVEGHTVITASEVYIGMGAGYGAGGGEGYGQPPAEGEAAEEAEAEAPEGKPATPVGGEGYGGGGGGGGFSAGRPVAAIIVEPQGVRVEPIVDVTKLGLAFFTTLGSLFFMASRMKKR